MRFLIRAAITSAYLCAILPNAWSQATGPVNVPTKVVGNQWIIRASVDGREGWYLLSTSSKTSILLPRTGQKGAEGRTQRAPVSIGPVNGDDVSFKVITSPNLKTLGVDGVLGADALANFNLSIDIEEAQVGTWVEQPSLFSERGWILLLPVLASATQHASTLSIQDVDIVPYGVPFADGLATGLAVLQTSDPIAKISSQAVAAGPSLPIVEGSSGSTVVDGVTVGEIGPFWSVISNSRADLPYASKKQIASFPIASLPVRRMVLDGHTGTIITEQLGSSGVDALQLSRLLGIPVDIEQGTLYIRHEGALYGTDLVNYERALVVDVGAIPSVEIVAALQGTSEVKLDMLKKLATARAAGYKLNMLFEGKEYATNVKPPK